MKFYTHYSTTNNGLFLRYVDDDGKRQRAEIDFSPSYYIESKNSENVNTDLKTIYGKPLMKRTVKNSKALFGAISKSSNVENYTFFGTRNAALQYIVEEFGNVFDTFEPELIKRVNVDIETRTDNSIGVPNVEEVKEIIELISCKDSLKGITTVFHLDDIDIKHKMFEGYKLKFYKCGDEMELLKRFVAYIVHDYPDIICGWNIGNFDIPYLVNRIEKICGKTFAKRLSPIGKIKKKKSLNEHKQEVFDYTIVGVEIVDTLLLYKKIELSPRESYKLDTIAKIELNAGKLSHPSSIAGHKMYNVGDINKINTKKDWGEYEDIKKLIIQYKEKPTDELETEIRHHFYNIYALYNIVDVDRAFEIEEKKGLFQITFFVTYFSVSNFADSLSSMRTWSNLLYKHCLDNGVVFPINRKDNEKKEKYRGAYVRDPIAGRYTGDDMLVSFDVASMYPSIIRILNISPETILNKRIDINIEDLLEANKIDFDISDNYCFGVNGAVFDKSKQGILPKKVEELFMIRKKEKGKAKIIEEEIQVIEKILAEKRGSKNE